MISEYNLRLTSKNVADVVDLSLTADESEEHITRRIARTQIVRNLVDSSAAVKLTLMHQRRSPVRD